MRVEYDRKYIMYVCIYEILEKLIKILCFRNYHLIRTYYMRKNSFVNNRKKYQLFNCF